MQIEPAGTWPGGTRPAWPPAAWPIVPRWPATPMAGWQAVRLPRQRRSWPAGQRRDRRTVRHRRPARRDPATRAPRRADLDVLDAAAQPRQNGDDCSHPSPGGARTRPSATASASTTTSKAPRSGSASSSPGPGRPSGPHKFRWGCGPAPGGMRMAVRAWPADVGWPWICETIHQSTAVHSLPPRRGAGVRTGCCRRRCGHRRTRAPRPGCRGRGTWRPRDRRRRPGARWR